jgi:hypothetical protein
MVNYNLQIKRTTSRAGFTQRRDDATRTLPLALLLFLTQKRCVVAASREAKCLVSDGRLQPANQKGNVKGWFHATTRRRNENLTPGPALVFDPKALRRCGVA